MKRGHRRSIETREQNSGDGSGRQGMDCGSWPSSRQLASGEGTGGAEELEHVKESGLSCPRQPYSIAPEALEMNLVIAPEGMECTQSVPFPKQLCKSKWGVGPFQTDDPTSWTLLPEGHDDTRAHQPRKVG